MNTLVRVNLFLVSLVAVLGLIAWFQPGIEKPSLVPVVSANLSDAVHVQIHHNEQLHLELRKTSEGWQLEGQPIPADRVELLLQIASLPSLKSFVPDDVSLAQFGLSPPRYRLTIDNQVIALGGVDPITDLRYLQTGNRVHLVSDGFTQYLLAPKADWLK
ncbi:MAG: hypothetical protein ACWA5Q_11485 [bacterium]